MSDRLPAGGGATSGTLLSQVKRDGFVMLPDFFAPEQAAQAHREILAWYEQDLAERQQRGLTEPRHDGVAGVTILTRPTHLMLDVYGRSPALDAMFEQFLDHPTRCRRGWPRPCARTRLPTSDATRTCTCPGWPFRWPPSGSR